MGRLIPLLLLAMGCALLPAWAAKSRVPTEPVGSSNDAARVHDRFAQWEGEIGAFERADAVNPPPADAIEFLGSSTIRMWNLERWFPGMPVFNRGFGGSEIEDSTRFAPRIVLKYRPRLIVFYAGDNDINSRKTPRRVLSDFRAFSREVHRALPQTKILFLSIKPSVARVRQIPAQQEANRLVARYCKRKRWLHFVDMTDLLLDAGGKPRPELFRSDGPHMNNAGQALWHARLKPPPQTVPRTRAPAIARPGTGPRKERKEQTSRLRCHWVRRQARGRGHYSALGALHGLRAATRGLGLRR